MTNTNEPTTNTTAGHPASECADRDDMAVARRQLEDAQALVLEAVRRINAVEAATDVRNHALPEVKEAFGAAFRISDALDSLHTEDAGPKWVAA